MRFAKKVTILMVDVDVKPPDHRGDRYGGKWDGQCRRACNSCDGYTSFVDKPADLNSRYKFLAMCPE